MSTPNSTVSFAPLPRTSTLPQVIEYVQKSFALLQRALSPSVGTLQVNNTTPSVQGSSMWRTNNSSPTTITAFLFGIPEQEIVLLATDSHTTIADNTTIITKSGAAVVLALGDTMHLATPDGVVWSEV